jgi:hypothetical protein
MRCLVLVLVLVVTSCSGEAPLAPPSPAPPASTADQDALWRLAPADLTVGLVVSPQGLASAERGFLAIKQIFDTTLGLSYAAKELELQLRRFVNKSRITLATMGMSPNKGMAWFRHADGTEVAILPVVDPASFVTAFHGARAANGDVVGDYICKPLHDVYACSKSADAWSRLGQGTKRDVISLAGARGDVEVYADLHDAVDAPLELAAVAQLTRGTVLIRGGLRGIPELAAVLPPIRTQVIEANKAVGFAVLNLAPLLSFVNAHRTTVVSGVSIADVARALAGPVSMYIAPDVQPGGARIPVADEALAQKLVERCDEINVEIFKVRDGRCELHLSSEAALDVWRDSAGIRIGKRAGRPSTATVRATPLAVELEHGWALAVYGRGTAFADRALPTLPAFNAFSARRLEQRALMMVSELGLGIRAEGDVIRLVAGIRTVWSNPDDVLARIVAIDPAKSEPGAQAAAIAKAFPRSPFASDMRGDLEGLTAPVTALAYLGGMFDDMFDDLARE